MREGVKRFWAIAVVLVAALAFPAGSRPAAAQDEGHWAWVDMYGHCASVCQHPPFLLRVAPDHRHGVTSTGRGT
jgi:hypothetical protein